MDTSPTVPCCWYLQYRQTIRRFFCRRTHSEDTLNPQLQHFTVPYSCKFLKPAVTVITDLIRPGRCCCLATAPQTLAVFLIHRASDQAMECLSNRLYHPARHELLPTATSDQLSAIIGHLSQRRPPPELMSRAEGSWSSPNQPLSTGAL